MGASRWHGIRLGRDRGVGVAELVQPAEGGPGVLAAVPGRFGLVGGGPGRGRQQPLDQVGPMLEPGQGDGEGLLGIAPGDRHLGAHRVEREPKEPGLLGEKLLGSR